MRFLKGQYFSFDAIIGGTIFILTAIALFSYWNGINSSFDQAHDMLAREAFRISETMLTPVPPGFSVGWRDQHINYSMVGDGCDALLSGPTAEEAFGSGYLVSVYFVEISDRGDVTRICTWGVGEDELNAQSAYRMRRPVSYMKEDGDTALGYFDVLVYEQPRNQ
ncbi:MAG: hypothetical protein PHQ80_03390 [Candidatus ainarchaeum sp.]|nr:hypothetical protein [Candidatus ainarchaeum sp.]MDD5096536.1 hypothetical protein [Candidatus ainarchaeum sp.]